jgi:hypothetical protein
VAIQRGLAASARVDSVKARSVCLRQSEVQADGIPMTLIETAKCILTDSHFLIPLIVFCIGLTLLIALH